MASMDVGKQLSYSIDLPKRLVLVRFTGKLTAHAITSYTASLREDPQFDPHFSEIVDLTGVEEIEITPAEAIALADACDPFDHDSWRAFVTSKEVQTNSARMHQILRSPAKNIAIFDTMSSAEQWIQSASARPATTKSRVFRFPSRTQ